jgi:hypothetical protein
MARTIEGKMPHGQGLSLYSQSSLSTQARTFLVRCNTRQGKIRPASGAADGFSEGR